MSHRKAVDHVINAIRRRDADAYTELFAEEAVFENPLAPEPLSGRAHSCNWPTDRGRSCLDL